MREAHRRWHDCADGYGDAADFVDGLNSAVQALRNITFVMQSAKSLIPGFEKWYATQQDRMKADPVLRWVVDARNAVVKQGDLRARSIREAALVTTYEQEGALMQEEVLKWELLERRLKTDLGTGSDPLRPVRGILREIEDLQIPPRLRDQAAVHVENRWIVDDFPEHELLSLLAYAYGELRQIVIACHELFGGRVVAVKGPHWRPAQPVEISFGGRQPCMLDAKKYQVARYRLKDGEPVQFAYYRAEWSEEIADRIKREQPYGPLEISTPDWGDIQSITQAQSAVDHFMKLGEVILKSGEEHGSFVYSFRQGNIIDARIVLVEDAQGKRALSAEIAETSRRLSADCVIFVGEIWVGKLIYDDDRVLIPAGEQNDRTEALIIELLASSGVSSVSILPFTTTEAGPPRKVELGPTEPASAQRFRLGLFEPVARLWGLPGRSLPGASFFRSGGGLHRASD